MPDQYLPAGRRPALFAPARGGSQLHRTASVIALATGMIGLGGLMNPAAAQCVQGPPAEFTCSGELQIGQIIIGPDTRAVAAPGFKIDTTNNGNALAFGMTGAGQITYLDYDGAQFTGAGVRLTSAGDSNANSGSLVVYANSVIVANGANGLRLDNAGGGDIEADWLGSILNTGGNGVLVDADAGSGNIEFSVDAVRARDTGVLFDFDGNGSLTFVANGDIVGETGSGIEVDGGSATGSYDLQTGLVTGGTWGILIDNQGVGSTRVTTTGAVTGLGEAGIKVDGGADTTGIDILANKVSGETYGIQVTNSGSGAINISASGTVTGANATGIVAVNDVNAGNLSMSLADVSGATGVIAQNYGTGVTQILSTGAIEGLAGDGVRLQNASTATHAVVNVEDVTGAATGIEVVNFGDGTTIVESTGSVVGAGEHGVYVQTGAASDGVLIDVVNVQGEDVGVLLSNQGEGAALVKSTGQITALGNIGVYVANGASSTDIIIDLAEVSGAQVGLATNHEGLGSTEITAAGPISGGLLGISAYAGTTADDMTIEVSDVTGGGAGIDIVNFGAGQTNVASTGVVSGFGGRGISVVAGTTSQGVGVAVNEVHGQETGVYINNQGAGATIVASTGEISAVTGAGVVVSNGATATDIQIQTASVAGGDRGISAFNEGLGGIQITADGPVSGADFGILAEGGPNATNIAINAVDVTSEGAAIQAANAGIGFTRVVSTGSAAGGDYGIRAYGGPTGSTVLVEANNATGGLNGISAIGFGQGPVEVVVHGVVEGGDEGVEAFSDIQGVNIANGGTIRNLSGLSIDRAVEAQGEFVALHNTGLIVGRLDLTSDAGLVVNHGVWNGVGGTSSFVGGDDSLFNMSSGEIVGGAAAGLAETTTWSGLEAFTNRGLLRLADGGAGDVIQTSAATTFVSASVLAADVGGAATADVFRTTGTVEIEPGSRLTINATQPLVLHGQYVVVEAAGGVIGEFDFEDQMITAFAGVRDGYTATTAYVEFAQMKALAEAGLTPNQKETAEGADSLPDGDAVKDALLMLPDDASAQAAFDQLSGEIHPALRTAMVEDSRLPRTAVLDRLADAEPRRSAWGRVFGSFGASDGDSNAGELDRDARGMVLGVDRTIGDITVGLAGGLFETEVDLGTRDSVATVESVHGLAYAGGRFGAWTVRGGVGYAVTSADTRRQVAFPGFAQEAKADYDGSVLQAFIETGYRLSLSGGAHVELFVGLTSIQVETDAFTESGGPALLSGRSRTEQTAISTLGLRFGTDPEAPYGLGGSVGWRHSWGDLDPTGVHAFDGGAPFTVIGAAQSSDAAFANVQARWRVTPAATFGIAYDGVVGGDSQDHALTGSLRVVF